MKRHHWSGNVRYEGQNRKYYVSLAGGLRSTERDAIYWFTSTSLSGRRIYTHFVVSYRDLLNKGITLPVNMRPVGPNFIGPMIEPKPIK